jgi:hypothetical protein
MIEGGDVAKAPTLLPEVEVGLRFGCSWIESTVGYEVDLRSVVRGSHNPKSPAAARVCAGEIGEPLFLWGVRIPAVEIADEITARVPHPLLREWVCGLFGTRMRVIGKFD